jgi:hypothetical protein
MPGFKDGAGLGVQNYSRIGIHNLREAGGGVHGIPRIIWAGPSYHLSSLLLHITMGGVSPCLCQGHFVS